MKKLLELGNQYLKQSDWKDLALIKFCLCAMGVIIGMQFPKKYRKTVTTVAAVVFVATYIPLMAKLFKIMFQMLDEEKLFEEK